MPGMVQLNKRTEGIIVDELTNLTEENIRELELIEEYLSLDSNLEGE